MGLIAHKVFHSVHRYLKNANSNHICACKPTRMSGESIKLSVASNNSLIPALSYININIEAKFDGSCLKQDKGTFTHKKVVNIYIVFQINLLPFDIDKIFCIKKFFPGSREIH